MMCNSRVGKLAVVALVLTWLSPVWGEEEKKGKDLKPQELVERSRITFESFMNDDHMTWMHKMMRHAKGVLIVPQYLRAGFIFGGAGGSGVYLARDKETGKWSYPAFYTEGGVSFGLQAGADAAEIIVIARTERGAEAFYRTKLTLGADVSIAAGPVGAGAAASITADLISFSLQKGLYAGTSLDGSVITPRDGNNSAYYGKEGVTATDILVKRSVKNPKADSLMAAVSKASAPVERKQ